MRIAVRAAGINFPDLLMIEGKYQFKPELPFVPGMEAAGDVIEVDGRRDGSRAGDKVIAKMRHGAFSEEVVVAPGSSRRCRRRSTMRKARPSWPPTAPPITR